MKKYIVEIIIFLAGALTMVFEIVGSRVLGPFFGTSVFVWTSLIGIIMGSLSVGYWMGGKISEQKIRYNILILDIADSSFFVMIAAVGNNYILNRISEIYFGFQNTDAPISNYFVRTDQCVSWDGVTIWS